MLAGTAYGSSANAQSADCTVSPLAELYAVKAAVCPEVLAFDSSRKRVFKLWGSIDKTDH
jgi:hypothetical protein